MIKGKRVLFCRAVANVNVECPCYQGVVGNLVDIAARANPALPEIGNSVPAAQDSSRTYRRAGACDRQPEGCWVMQTVWSVIYGRSRLM
jgi:hypothetical protein